MKKIISALMVCCAMVLSGSIFAQNLEESKLGKWNRPEKTDIAAVDKYVDYCANMYDEAMSIREDFDNIEQAEVNMETVSEEALGESEDLKDKSEEYKEIIKRITAQQEAAKKLPDLLAAATSATPKGLKAVATTKAIISTKDAVKLAIQENVEVLKAANNSLKNIGGSSDNKDESEG